MMNSGWLETLVEPIPFSDSVGAVVANVQEVNSTGAVAVVVSVLINAEIPITVVADAAVCQLYSVAAVADTVVVAMIGGGTVVDWSVDWWTAYSCRR